MTQTDQDLKKVAEASAPAVAQLVSDTNEVIKTMQATWSMEEKIQFCKWFLGVQTVEQMAESMGMTLVEEEDDSQLPLFEQEDADEASSDADNPD